MSVFSAMDFFHIVTLLEKHLGQVPSFSTHLVSTTGKPVLSANGTSIVPDEKLDLETNYDLIVVPPMEGPSLVSGSWKTTRVTEALSHYISNNVPVLVMTTGTIFLAASGLVNHVLMATHWAYIRYLKEQFPDCQFTAYSSYVHIEGIYTTGSLDGCFDALLEFISSIKGDRFSQLCATHLLVSDPGKLSPMLPGYRNHRDELIMKVQDWIENQYASPITILLLADTFGCSERNLKRRFQVATGTSVNRYIQEVRIDKTKKLLLSSNLSIKEIAYEVGYENVSFFIRLFKRNIGITPSAWRAGESVS